MKATLAKRPTPVTHSNDRFPWTGSVEAVFPGHDKRTRPDVTGIAVTVKSLSFHVDENRFSSGSLVVGRLVRFLSGLRFAMRTDTGLG